MKRKEEVEKVLKTFERGRKEVERERVIEIETEERERKS